MIDRDRVVSQFIEMVKISSESLQEREMADYLIEFFKKEFSVDVFEDNAGSKIGGSTGNLIVKIDGKGEPLLLTAHIDTVKPGRNVNPLIKDDRVVSDGTTILGADDKSGIAMIIEALRVIKENNFEMPSLEIVFTVAEEIGLLGAKNLDKDKLKAKYGIALDSEDIEGVYNRAPSQNSITIEFYGKKSHAGMAPELGLNAILLASESISNMPIGRLDAETTSNIGVIEGGVATNIVPDRVVVKGEVRSHDEDKLEYYTNRMREEVYNSVRRNYTIIGGKKYYGNVSFNAIREYSRMYVKEDSYIVDIMKKAYMENNEEMKLLTGGGGSDANIFNGYGIETVIMGTGMQNVHTVDEYIKIEDLVRGSSILLSILKNWAND